MIPTVAPYLLPSALPRLRARNLSLDLGVREAQTDRLIEEVRQGALDAAVVALPVAEPGLVARRRSSTTASCSPAATSACARFAEPRRIPRTWSRGSCCCSTTATA